ncbi:molybdopterin converting factor subunit 1 [Nonomuraea guangzhouensis]|uniref:Molybdopterin synthase sulfur carrier subunit n=1 Tax=Nonomuraea guangzhouensis TaxID=1291555 RepID=A0ABW4G587_9ACTN|nr:molybdopterin converting factor subunit 1 [Nonomuraea guangzhouensis]
MNVRVLYFGAIHDRVTKVRSEMVTLESGATVSDLLQQLNVAHPGLNKVRSHVRIAVNESIVEISEALNEGDDVALIPPVAGG